MPDTFRDELDNITNDCMEIARREFREGLKAIAPEYSQAEHDRVAARIESAIDAAIDAADDADPAPVCGACDETMRLVPPLGEHEDGVWRCIRCHPYIGDQVRRTAWATKQRWEGTT
jgi:hypothetical protein